MWYIILGAIIFALSGTIYQTTRADKAKINHLHDIAQNLNFDLGVSRESIKILNEKNTRLTEIIKTLRSRNKVYSMSATRFVSPDTDIRVIQVYAREELAIALQKDGIITYKVEEKHRDDLNKDQVTVTATINVNKIKP
jgi:hypothetical protein